MSGASHRSSGSGYTEFLVINRLKEVNRDFLSKPETLGGFLIACDFCFLAVARRCARQCQRRHRHTRLLWCSPDSRRDAFFVECKSHCGDRRGFGRCSDLPDGA